MQCCAARNDNQEALIIAGPEETQRGRARSPRDTRLIANYCVDATLEKVHSGSEQGKLNCNGKDSVLAYSQALLAPAWKNDSDQLDLETLGSMIASA